MENKYQNGKIYRVVCNKTGLVYIGSTYDTLTQRLCSHRSDYRKWSVDKTKNTCSSIKVLENEDYDIILIENYPCNSKDELHSRERYYIEQMECVNVNIPTRTKQEYREENKEYISNRFKEYYHKNHDKMIERGKKYHAENKDKDIQRNSLIAEMPPIKCECGDYYTYKHKTRHLKTMKHIKKLEETKLNKSIV